MVDPQKLKKLRLLGADCRLQAPSPSKMMIIPFRQPLVNDITSECMQIAQIVDESTEVCYEFVKDIARKYIIVHYIKDDNYIVKQYTDKNITFENSIQFLRLPVDRLTLDDDFAYYGIDNLLKLKVCDLPLLQGTIKSPN